MPEPLKTFRRPNISRYAAGLGLLYAVLGVAWILLSDSLVASLSDDPHWLAAAQRYKGVLYVFGTSLGLVFLVNAGYRRLSDARHRTEATELQVRDLFLQHPKPMWVYDKQTLRFLAVNDAATRYYGYTREEFLAMDLRGLRLPEDVPRMLGLAAEAMEGHRDVGVLRHRKKSGELVFAHLALHTIEFQGRKAAMVMAIDVTADVLSKRALERQEAQFRQLHQSLSDALWIGSADGRTVLYISPAIEQIYGFSTEQMLADPTLWLRVVHPEDVGIAKSSGKTLLAVGEARSEYRIRTAAGDIKWVSDRKRLIVDDEGLVTMMGGIVKDITAIKEQEARRLLDQAELERLVALRTAELVRVNAELDAFAMTVAHDLRSPLVSVVGFTQLLQKKHGAALQDSGMKLAARIERSARQMAGLVSDLLALSRVATTVLAVGEVDLVPIAREVLEELQEQEPHRTLRFDAPPALVVQADPSLVRPLLANLLGNAWKFSGKRDAAHITLELQPGAPGCTVVEIRDNGAGFDTGGAELVFKPFQRFHSLSEFSGTGIGLTTCERIMARHGGSLRVASVPGEGTSVFASFPAACGAPE